MIRIFDAVGSSLEMTALFFKKAAFFVRALPARASNYGWTFNMVYNTAYDAMFN
jgi:hypothetical protein